MKCTLGFPSRIEAISALRREGKTEREIAERLRIKPNTVTSIECRARKRQASARHRVQLSGNVFADMEREAARRGIGVSSLVDQLLHAVAVDRLYAAVLDEA